MSVGKKSFKKRDSRQEIGGMNIFTDNHDRYVYRDPISKTGYLIEGRVKEFRTYSARFIIGLFAGIVTYVFQIPWYICIVIGIIAWFVMEIKFRSFLKHLPQIPNFTPAEKTDPIVAESKKERNTIILKLVLFIVVAVLIVINAYQSKFEGAVLILNYIIALGALYYAFREFKALMHNVSKK